MYLVSENALKMFGGESEQQTLLSTPRHSGGDSRNSTSQTQTIETMRNILESVQPTQVSTPSVIITKAAPQIQKSENPSGPKSRIMQKCYKPTLKKIHSKFHIYLIHFSSQLRGQKGWQPLLHDELFFLYYLLIKA